MEQEQQAPPVAQEIQPIQKPRNTKKFGLVAAALLMVLAVPLTLSVLSQQTVSRNNASGKEPTPQLLVTKAPMTETFKNINSASDTLTGVNPDGSMGPETSVGNWSNTVPVSLQGKLSVAFDTEDVKGDSDKMMPSGTVSARPSQSLSPRPSRVEPSETEDKMDKVASGTPGWKGKDKKSTVKSLFVTISKVEVHVVHYGKSTEPTRNPSGMTAVSPTLVPTLLPTVKPTSPVLGVSTVPVTPTAAPGPVDHWETLTLPSSVVVDLMHVNAQAVLNKIGLTSLAAGKYSEIRIYVKNANVVTLDGTTAQATISGKYNIIRIVQSFSVLPGMTTSLSLSFDPRHSLVNANGVYTLKPVISKMQEEHK